MTVICHTRLMTKNDNESTRRDTFRRIKAVRAEALDTHKSHGNSPPNIRDLIQNLIDDGVSQAKALTVARHPYRRRHAGQSPKAHAQRRLHARLQRRFGVGAI